MKTTKSRPLRTVFLTFLGLIIVFWVLVLFRVGLRKYLYWAHKQNRPKQAEAEIVLDGILDAQKKYYDSNGKYADNLVELKYVVPAEIRYYTALLGESAKGPNDSIQMPPPMAANQF